MFPATCILIIVSMLKIIYSFDIDYYYSSPLRSEEVNCIRVRNVFCQLKCSLLSSLCVNNKCYCLTLTSPDHINRRETALRSPDHDTDYGEDEQTHPVNNEIGNNPNELRPVLRHHIAHFCPNLDVARECIKKCMKIGKPAFCGKDHVCYCGHKYDHMEDDPKNNAKDIYAQFKDLYQIYFGEPNPVANDSENNDST